MIGVVSKPEERVIIEEFFQLFKTPWEFYDPDRSDYQVLLITNQEIPNAEAPLVFLYGSEDTAFDRNHGCSTASFEKNWRVRWHDFQMPIYGNALTFVNVEHPNLFCSPSGDAIGYEMQKGPQRIVRIGYNLFEEMSILLTKGQSVENALIPTLDLHIDMLRYRIVETGITLFEIPPVPAGYEMIACLTHDVDFIGIRQHFLDHSMMGFLYRATLGSLVDFVQKRTSLAKLRENLKAALLLPFVYMGIYPDPLDQFDRCLELEEGAPSTFFFIPYKNRPGIGFEAKRNRYRAAKYDVEDVQDKISMILEHVGEAGVHGIDSWHDAELGKNELSRVRSIAGQEKTGIRVHWLCRNEKTFQVLDQAGYHYDSSIGYNEAVGFWSGTAQAYKPLDAEHLFELPMHIQDTALFRSDRMRATKKKAEGLCDKIMEVISTYGGVATILWHQRSFGPERLWGNFYKMIIEKLKKKNAWFATAVDVVDWFRLRRAVRFSASGSIEFPHNWNSFERLPPLILRRHSEVSTVYDQKLAHS